MRRSLWLKIPALAAAVACVWLDGSVETALFAGIAVALVALMMVAVMHPNSSAWVRTLWRAPREKEAVALTFDDGPDLRATPAILEILEEHGVRAAFFVVGERARAHPELVARLHEAGHLVCNHTDTHSPSYHFQLWGFHRRELRACNDSIAEVLGKEPTLFRSPQGAKNPALGDVLREESMIPVGWQVRGLDTLGSDAATIARRVVRGAEPGGVILLHDGGGLGGSEDRSPTIRALPRIIAGLRERGMRFARLDELLEVEPYRPVPAQSGAQARAQAPARAGAQARA